MKFIIFVFTVLFMLTVTLQESLAQAATKTAAKNANKTVDAETEEFIKKFTDDPENFYPQTSVKNSGISQTEGEDGSSDPAGSDAKRLNVSIDRHQDTTYKKAAANKGMVREAIGGSKTESER